MERGQSTISSPSWGGYCSALGKDGSWNNVAVAVEL